MTDRRGAIDRLLTCAEYFKNPRFSEIPFMCNAINTMYEVVDLMRQQEPHVLTRDEMIEAGKNHDAVYVEEYPNSNRRNRWAIAIEGVDPPEHGFNYPGGVQFNAVDADDDMFDGDLYWHDGVLSWRAWSAKPTEEQMKEVNWDA